MTQPISYALYTVLPLLIFCCMSLLFIHFMQLHNFLRTISIECFYFYVLITIRQRFVCMFVFVRRFLALLASSFTTHYINAADHLPYFKCLSFLHFILSLYIHFSRNFWFTFDFILFFKVSVWYVHLSILLYILLAVFILCS